MNREQTQKIQSFVFSKCNSYRVNNFYTNGETCPNGFNKFLLNNVTQYEQTYRTECWRCGFLGLSTCCRDVVTGIGRRSIILYKCIQSSVLRLSLGVPRSDSPYVYGGSYASNTLNPITNEASCPPMFSAVKIASDINVCFTRETVDTKDFPFFGGFYSCDGGNILLSPPVQKCPEGYSTHIMGNIDTECLLYVCLKFMKFDESRQLPPVVVPPFFHIEIKNQTINQQRSKIEDVTPKSSNYATLGISIGALVVSALLVVVFGVFLIKRRYQKAKRIGNNTAESIQL